MISSDFDLHLDSGYRGDAQESDLFADFRQLDSVDENDYDSCNHQEDYIKRNHDSCTEISSDFTDDEKEAGSINVFTEFCHLGDINMKPPVSKLYTILSPHSKDCIGIPGIVDTFKNGLYSS